MTNTARRLAGIATAWVVWLVVLCLPVVPVLQSPVVQDPIDRSTFVAVAQLLVAPLIMGVRLKATWMTFPALMGVVAAGMIMVRFLNRRFFRPR